MTEKLITADEARQLVLDLITRFPDHTNPNNGTACVYLGWVNGEERRCIIGQLAFEQGWLPPSRDSGSVRMIARTLRWPLSDEAVDVLEVVQNRADSRARPWSEVLPVVELSERIMAVAK